MSGGDSQRKAPNPALHHTDNMDSTTPPPIVPPPPPAEEGLRFGPIIRDVVIIVVLTAMGGFVIGLTGTVASQRGMVAIMASNLLFGTVGFIISGCLAPGERWPHLAYVAVGVWLFGLVNVIFFRVGIVQWFFSSIAVGLMMGLGGACSYVFRRDKSPPAS